MRDSDLKNKYGEIYLQITHLQRYLEKCLIALQEQARLRDHFMFDNKQLELLVACLRIIKEEMS